MSKIAVFKLRKYLLVRSSVCSSVTLNSMWASRISTSVFLHWNGNLGHFLYAPLMVLSLSVFLTIPSIYGSFRTKDLLIVMHCARTYIAPCVLWGNCRVVTDNSYCLQIELANGIYICYRSALRTRLFIVVFGNNNLSSRSSTFVYRLYTFLQIPIGLLKLYTKHTCKAGLKIVPRRQWKTALTVFG